jgi:Uri superfamily endonuclease
MKGIYILKIKLKNNIILKIGKLGNIKFNNGYYYYIGSAQNNLENRIKRHLRKNKKFHWHIDNFLKDKNTKIIKIHYNNKNKDNECKTAKILLKKGIPIKRFGCSDCRCISHLIKINKPINIKSFKEFKYYQV